MSKKIRPIHCPCGKNGYEDEHDALKTLGRVRTERRRKADSIGTRRGLELESRVYYCWVGDCFHLTSQSHRSRRIVGGPNLAVAA